jgi:RimJ/RimL family protein N-acetyltransferase
MSGPFNTPRLQLITGTPETVASAIDDLAALGAHLDAAIPASWPPEHLDTDALSWTLRWLSDPANDPRWGFYWVVLRDPRVLVGVAGYKGMPVDGTVELGYGVASDYRRRGFATEATRALIAHAFTHPEVERVIAETLPDLAPSIGVLKKCGFTLIGEGSEPGVIRYELRRQNRKTEL